MRDSTGRSPDWRASRYILESRRRRGRAAGDVRAQVEVGLGDQVEADLGDQVEVGLGDRLGDQVEAGDLALIGSLLVALLVSWLLGG